MLYSQGDYIIAYCPALDLSSYAKTEKEAIASFREALDLFLEYFTENGTLGQNVVACGWKLRQGYLQPEVWFDKALVLEDYAVEFGYPDTKIVLSGSDIEKAIKIAKECRAFIIPKLNLHCVNLYLHHILININSPGLTVIMEEGAYAPRCATH